MARQYNKRLDIQDEIESKERKEKLLTTPLMIALVSLVGLHIFTVFRGVFFSPDLENEEAYEAWMNVDDQLFQIEIILFISIFIYAIIVGIFSSKYKVDSTSKYHVKERNHFIDAMDVLPSSYNLIYNVDIVDKKQANRKTTLDLLIIGPTGVFLVAINTRAGVLHGNAQNDTWKKNKVGRGGTPWEEEFKNPLKYLDFQSHLLDDVLHSHNYHIVPKTYCVFTSCTKLYINSSRCIKGADKLVECVKNQPKSLRQNQIDELTNWILGKD